MSDLRHWHHPEWLVEHSHCDAASRIIACARTDTSGSNSSTAIAASASAMTQTATARPRQ
uniref:Uncharacterized protein n=1 Tax=Ralstonia solanacearum CFBP2957 TaxID=859656 RepID=D8P3T3_RALSL|nr:protein of unknown function [Ralstonia solanacearum CFBP2957]